MQVDLAPQFLRGENITVGAVKVLADPFRGIQRDALQPVLAVLALPHHHAGEFVQTGTTLRLGIPPLIHGLRAGCTAVFFILCRNAPQFADVKFCRR